MDATSCFQCGGDIPKGAYTMLCVSGYARLRRRRDAQVRLA